MKAKVGKIKYQRDQMRAYVQFGKKSYEVDLAGFITQITKIVSQVNDAFDNTKNAVNRNETGFEIIRASAGAGPATNFLPGGAGAGAAEKEYHGKFYIYSEDAAADELWLCQKNASDTYTWVQITIP